jgi:hypothetical protein
VKALCKPDVRHVRYSEHHEIRLARAATMKCQLKESTMKTVKLVGLIGLVTLSFAGSAMAEQAAVTQNIAKRPLLEQSVAYADQAWEGASLKKDTHLQDLRAQTSLQFVSKRAYLASLATE